MKKHLLLPGVCCAILFLNFLSVQAQVKGDPSPTGSIEASAVQKTSSRISPELKKLADNAGARNKIAQAVKPLPGVSEDFTQFLQIRGDKIVIDVTAKSDVASTKSELQKLGFQVKASFGRVISGLMPISNLSQLEASSTIQYAKPAYKPFHQTRRVPASAMASYARYIYSCANPSAATQPNAATPGKAVIKPVISQGDTAQRSNIARTKYKVDGKGVKVGVLSDSYNNLGTANIGVLHGELPGPGNPFNYRKPVQVLEDLDSGGTDEGRAMIEIVHDVAPASELAFHTADNGQADFAQGIIKLADIGCDVIADDVMYYAEPYFQDGIIAQAVDQVKKKGHTYFSAAGNSSIRSYESPYRPSTYAPLGADNGTAHNFSAPSDPARYFQPIYIPPGGSIINSFQWDQSSFSASGVGCESDYDIYLLNSSLKVVAYSASDNLKSGDPMEIFGYFNNTSNYTFYLVILKYAGPDASRLKYVLYNNALFYLTNPAIPGILSPALVGHAKADGAIATGAAFYLETPAYGVDTPVVEGFSSVGGTANYYDIRGNRIPPLVRHKPDIVAPDGGNTSFFDPFGDGDIKQDADTLPNFFGTSAAAPHAAGVAALMIDAQKLRTITPDQIKGILGKNAIDMDNPYTPGFDVGFDFATGMGFIQADKSVGEVKFPKIFVKDLELKPLCSNAPNTIRNWEIQNPNPFPVKAEWLIVGSNQHGSIVVPPGDTTFSTTALYSHGYAVPMLGLLDWEDNFGFTRVDLAYSTKAACGKEAVSSANSDQLMKGVTPTLADGKPTNIAEVYPNPSASVFRLYLSLADQAGANIDLYSADGKKVQTRRIEQSNGVVDIDASGYKPGVYVLKLTQGGFTKTIKLIKQ